MRIAAILLLALLPALAPSAFAADEARGKALHDKQCVSCHVDRYGGDGSGMYLRPDRRVRDATALRQRVAACNAMTNAKWFPDEEEDVAAYLARRYYKFPG